MTPAEYAQNLNAGKERWKSFQAVGNREILDCCAIGLICSVKCPGSIVIKTFDAIRELRDAGIVVAGGFHSPMEGECLGFLLRGKQPVIVCLAKGLSRPRLPVAWREAVDAGRLLIITPFDDSVRRTTEAQAQSRNQFVAALGAAVLIPHASPGGKAEAIARELAASGKAVFTFDDPQNEALLQLGARRYDIDEIRRVTKEAKSVHSLFGDFEEQP